MAKDLYTLLRNRYPHNEYALMAEVRDAAGFNASRSADYIAVNLWPSRGLAINGIEVKSHRSDWLSELKKPEKAENIFKYCDYFWLLTDSDGVAKLEEIPASWGWLRVKGERIYTEKEAPKLEPKPLTRNFVCAMLKRAQDKTNFIHIDSISERIEKARQSGIDSAKRTIEQATNDLARLQKKVLDFEEASGVSLDFRWGINQPKIGHAVKIILDGGSESLKKELFDLEKMAQRVLNKISEGLKSIENGEGTTIL